MATSREESAALTRLLVPIILVILCATVVLAAAFSVARPQAPAIGAERAI